MKHFLMRCDTPNWANIMFFLLCYMHTVLNERLNQMRADEYDSLMGEERP